MKIKTLLLATLLSSLALSQAEEIMNIRAEVLETLTLRIDEHVNFGKIAKGSNNLQRGKFSVKGEVGELVKVELSGYNTDNGELIMKGVDGKTDLIALIESESSQSVRLDRDDFVSGQDILVRLDVPQNAKTQKYVGEILLKARYE